MNTANALAPVFVLVALGVALRRRGFASSAFFDDVNRLLYYIALPVLLFDRLASALPPWSSIAAPSGAMITGTLATMAIAYMVARGTKIPRFSQGAFVQASFRGNLIFVGLPIVLTMPDVGPNGAASIRQVAIFVIAPVMLLYNILGIAVLQCGDDAGSSGKFQRTFVQLLKTPPLLAIAGGMLFALSGASLPVFCARSLDLMSDVVLPLGMLGVGGELGGAKLAGVWRSAGSAAILKVAVAPAIGWLCGRWFGLAASDTKMIMILMAAPTAVVSYTFAKSMGGDGALASNGVVSSSILACIGIPVIMAFC